MYFKKLAPVGLAFCALSCGTGVRPMIQSRPSLAEDGTGTLTKVPTLPRLEVGESFIWGYYPGGGSKPRMYEGYIKLADIRGQPTLAMLTLFPDEPPSGEWVLHDGIGFDYDDVVAAFANPETSRLPREQMFGWDAQRHKWFPSTSQPNTSANTEKFNYRSAVIRSDHLAWRTRFGCYNGRDVRPVSTATGSCDGDEIVFQQIPWDRPPYVFMPYYSLKTGVTLYKLFNEDSHDPDAHVAMRLVYTSGRHGEKTFGDARLLPAYIASFKAARQDILVSGGE